MDSSKKAANSFRCWGFDPVAGEAAGGLPE